jgi:hypothetical protein
MSTNLVVLFRVYIFLATKAPGHKGEDYVLLIFSCLWVLVAIESQFQSGMLDFLQKGGLALDSIVRRAKFVIAHADNDVFVNE